MILNSEQGGGYGISNVPNVLDDITRHKNRKHVCDVHGGG